MNTDAIMDGAPRKAWTAPVLTQLTVDLTQIANKDLGAGDGNGTSQIAKKS